MLCHEFEEHLTDYLEGMLAAQKRTACHEHVLRCPVCHDLANEVRAVTEACRTAPLPVEMPDALPARVIAHTTPQNLMTCAEFEEHLTDYLDGFLPAPVFHRWERHAALCATCAELPGTVVRSIGACYTSLQHELEMPAQLHDAILSATIGTTNAREVQAPFFANLNRQIRSWLDVTLAPRYAAVATMILAAVLVGTTTMSDDGSIFGMYRTGLRLARESSARSATSAARSTALPEEVRRVAGALARTVENN